MRSTRVTLRINATTCAVFGAIFAIWPIEVSKLLGQMPSLILCVLGFALIAHAGHLLVVSFKKVISKFEVYYFSAGDQAWFLASLALLVTTDWISSPTGIGMTIAVSIMVSTIGLAQLWTYAEATDAGVPSGSETHTATDRLLMPANLSRMQAIGVSWLGIKTWVKIWLFFLNGVFLAAFLFIPSEIARVTLVAYVACLPLMLSFMIVQRGLTCLLGLGHLIPWTPLLVYVYLRLFTDSAGLQISSQTSPELFVFSITLFICVAICLVFDLYDLLRWSMGHRRRLGSPSEVRSVAKPSGEKR